jgi:sugar phosphate permease
VCMFALTYVNYATLHATRAIWSAATKDLKTFFSTDEIALMNGLFLASYAVGGIFTGQLADKYPKRLLLLLIFMLVGLLLFALGAMMMVAPQN